MTLIIQIIGGIVAVYFAGAVVTFLLGRLVGRWSFPQSAILAVLWPVALASLVHETFTGWR